MTPPSVACSGNGESIGKPLLLSCQRTIEPVHRDSCFHRDRHIACGIVDHALQRRKRHGQAGPPGWQSIIQAGAAAHRVDGHGSGIGLCDKRSPPPGRYPAQSFQSAARYQSFVLTPRSIWVTIESKQRLSNVYKLGGYYSERCAAAWMALLQPARTGGRQHLGRAEPLIGIKGMPQARTSRRCHFR
jgi:hypothetical protein